MKNKQKQRSEATKKKILECAEKLFCEKGFEKTTVKEIVAAAEVAQGTFYLYFETKEEALYKILEKILDGFNHYIKILDVKNPKMEDIDHLIDALVLHMEENLAVMRLLHASNIIEILKLNGPATQEIFYISIIEEWIVNAQEKKLFENKNPGLYARILLQIAHSTLETAFLYGYPDQVHAVSHEIKHMIRKILL